MNKIKINPDFEFDVDYESSSLDFTSEGLLREINFYTDGHMAIRILRNIWNKMDLGIQHYDDEEMFRELTDRVRNFRTTTYKLKDGKYSVRFRSYGWTPEEDKNLPLHKFIMDSLEKFRIIETV